MQSAPGYKSLSDFNVKIVNCEPTFILAFYKWFETFKKNILKPNYNARKYDYVVSA